MRCADAGNSPLPEFDFSLSKNAFDCIANQILVIRLLSNIFSRTFFLHSHSLTKTHQQQQQSNSTEWTVLRNKKPWARLAEWIWITAIARQLWCEQKTSRHVEAQHETELVNRLPFPIERAAIKGNVDEKLCRCFVGTCGWEMLLRTPVRSNAKGKNWARHSALVLIVWCGRFRELRRAARLCVCRAYSYANVNCVPHFHERHRYLDVRGQWVVAEKRKYKNRSHKLIIWNTFTLHFIMNCNASANQRKTQTTGTGYARIVKRRMHFADSRWRIVTDTCRTRPLSMVTCSWVTRRILYIFYSCTDTTTLALLCCFALNLGNFLCLSS